MEFVRPQARLLWTRIASHSSAAPGRAAQTYHLQWSGQSCLWFQPQSSKICTKIQSKPSAIRLERSKNQGGICFFLTLFVLLHSIIALGGVANWRYVLCTPQDEEDHYHRSSIRYLKDFHQGSRSSSKYKPSLSSFSTITLTRAPTARRTFSFTVGGFSGEIALSWFHELMNCTSWWRFIMLFRST